MGRHQTGSNFCVRPAVRGSEEQQADCLWGVWQPECRPEQVHRMDRRLETNYCSALVGNTEVVKINLPEEFLT